MGIACQLLENCMLLIIAVALNRFVTATFPSRESSYLEYDQAYEPITNGYKNTQQQKDVTTFLHEKES